MYFVKFPSNEDCNPDDKFSTSQLIVQAISASKDKQLNSSEIHNCITESHPEYKKSKADISNALSSNRSNCRTPDQTKIKIRSNQKSGEAL